MTQALDSLSPASVPTLMLFGARVSGLMVMAPVLSARPVPAMVRASLVVLLSVLMLPAVLSSGSTSVALTPGAFLNEALVGFVIGLGVALLVGAAETAGELLSVQIGLQGSALVDPLSQQQTTALGQFFQLSAIAYLLSLGAHTVILQALRASIESVPLGTGLDTTLGLARMARTGGSLFALGLQLAAPVIAVVLLVNVALAVLSRAAPQLNILSLAFPIQILAGLIALIASIPLLGSWFLGWEIRYVDIIDQLVGQLVGRPR